jgi:hypothetical protein
MNYVRFSALALLTLPVLAQAGDSRSLVGEGMASYYSSEFAGSRTANGERFDPGAMTAAHRSLAFHLGAKAGSSTSVTPQRVRSACTAAARRG